MKSKIFFMTRDDRIVSDRRRTQRLPTSGTASLEWVEGASSPRLTHIQVKNVSDEGMTVECPEHIEPQLVRITGEEWQCIGWLRHCHREQGRFQAGIQFAQKPYQKNCGEIKD